MQKSIGYDLDWENSVVLIFIVLHYQLWLHFAAIAMFSGSILMKSL